MAAVSIIIVTSNRLNILRECLASIAGNSCKDFEIIVGLNGEDSSTEEFLGTHNEVCWFKAEKATPGRIRNVAISKARGKWLLFFDDDVIVPADYIKEGLAIADKYEQLDLFGGPDMTPLDASFAEKSLGLALMSPLATAKTRYRHNDDFEMKIGNSSEEYHILCNLWVRRARLQEYGFQFDNRFFRNEENILLHQMKEVGGSLGYFPKLSVYHRRRASIKGIARSVFSSGKHRMRQFIYYPKMIRLLYLVPMIFVTYLFSTLFVDSMIYRSGVILYLGSSLLMTVVLIRVKRRELKYLPLIIFFQIWINLCYGFGLLFELIKLPFAGLYGLVKASRKYQEKA